MKKLILLSFLILLSCNKENELTTPEIQTVNKPTNLKFNQTLDSKIRIEWADNSNNEEVFIVEKKIGSSSFNFLKTLPANSTYYNDDDVNINNYSYISYRVYASKGNLKSDFSNTITVASISIQLTKINQIATNAYNIDILKNDTEAIIDEDKYIRIRDIPNMNIKKELSNTYGTAFSSFLSTNNNYYVFVQPNIVRIFSFPTLTLVESIITSGESFTTCCFTSDARYLYLGMHLGQKGFINKYSFNPVKKESEIECHSHQINDIHLTETDNSLISSSIDRTLKFWDTSNFQLQKLISNMDVGGGWNIKTIANMNELIFINNGKIMIYRLNDLSHIRTISTIDNGYSSFSITPDNHTLIAISSLFIDLIHKYTGDIIQRRFTAVSGGGKCKITNDSKYCLVANKNALLVYSISRQWTLVE